MFGFRKKSPVESGAAGEPERDYTVFAEGMQQFWRRRLPGAELGQDGVITVPELAATIGLPDVAAISRPEWNLFVFSIG